MGLEQSQLPKSLQITLRQTVNDWPSDDELLEMFRDSEKGYVRAFMRNRERNCCKWKQNMIRNHLRALYLKESINE